jgi:probable O-glycosylation ligase (exosortase A-associated)
VGPWIGILSYYLLALLGPQFIWYWAFEGLRVSYIVAAATLIGLIVKITVGQYNFNFLKTKLNFYVLMLFISVAISYIFGAFGHLNNKSYYDPDELIQRASKIYLFYFCATIAINDKKKLRYLYYVLVVTTIYFVYWANFQYFSGNWGQFNAGRLMGPNFAGSSVYGDENAFAMLFVAGLPYIFYAGIMTDMKWLKYTLWGIMPFGCHAIFLTGSRGALLGFGVTTLIFILLSKRKYFAILIIPLLLIFFQLQGGSVMKERSNTITSYEGEASAESRLTVWSAGLKMVADHPITGVGVGSFMTALPFYSDLPPIIAHNTLVQFSAESGLGAGICYLMIVYRMIVMAKQTGRWCDDHQNEYGVPIIACINNANIVSFCGLLVCSVFLALNYYEIYFYLLIVSNTLTQLCHESDLADLKYT